MNAEKPKHDPQDLRLDENDPVWLLLARAPQPEPDGWFTARTLARCRQEGRSAGIYFAPVWRWALGGGLGICLAVLLMVPSSQPQPAPKQENVQEAFEIVASIDTDSDSSTSSSWQETTY